MTSTQIEKDRLSAGQVLPIVLSLLVAIFAFQLNASMLSPALATMERELQATTAEIGLTRPAINNYFPSKPALYAEVAGRAILVRSLQMLPVECVARAYLTGGGLTEYLATGTVSGVALPPGLTDGSRLPAPVFTPSTKAPAGQHDEPIGYAAVVDLVGEATAARAAELTTAILSRANAVAAERGILIADTKVEFGLDPSPAAGGGLVLADEVLTPDSSRFWPADQWRPGGPQPSYDKQFVRDWLTSPAAAWDRNGSQTPPPLPTEVVERTRAKYVQAYERLTGRTF